MIDWALIPTAGKGTRMYPAAAVIPKALLPVGTWPMLHWALDEVVRAGIRGAVIVHGPEQGLLRDYLEAARAAAACDDRGDLGKLGRQLRSIQLRWIEQAEPRGVGDAFMHCRGITGSGPFAVLLPDNWFLAGPPAIGQVMETFARTGLCTLGLTRVPPEEATLFGNVGGVELEALDDAPASYRIVSLQDKLPGTFADSPLAGSLRGCARYVLTSEFYDALSETGPPSRGEWDDVPAFQRLLRRPGLAGHRIEGQHYDVGLPAGYLAAAAYLARLGVDRS